jgi:O-methyltransferase
LETTAFPAEEIDVRVAGDDARLVLPSRGTEYRLNATGRVIAEELQRPVLISDIERRLTDEFDVGRNACAEAVQSFLASLRASGVIELFDDDEAPLRRRYLELLKRLVVNLVYPEHDLRVDELETHGRGSDPVAHERRMRDLRYLEAETFDSVVLHKRQGASWKRRPSRFAHTMIGLRRLDNLDYCAAHVFANAIPGDFLEAGVLQGGASIFLRGLQVAYGQGDRCVWLADSFAGPPTPSHPIDRDIAGFTEAADPWLGASLTAVRDNFRAYDLLSDHVRFIEGWFSESLPAAPIDRLAILRLDAGLYEATTAVLENLYDAVSPGGFIVIDDYNVFEPCRKAVDEFRARRGDTAPLRRPDWNSAYWQKLPSTI